MILVDEEDTDYTEPHLTVYYHPGLREPRESPFHQKLKHRRIRMTKPRSLLGRYYVVEIKRMEESKRTPITAVDDRLQIRVCHDTRYHQFGGEVRHENYFHEI